ncbi:hepatocyte growth factor-regulated tyrosine kinase substrate isoform X2 [Photinus pyralis]|nr:hepatocyte growth factor-regulated tyrosine kinase substrate isoform X2 [Photinus pyralis]
MASIKKKLYAPNPHTALYALQVLESLVKNCGNVIHEELTLKVNCDMLHDLAKTTQHENVRQKLLELIQTWTFAFRKNPRHSALKDVMNLMKAEGYKFPTLRESDAMFTADSAPEWVDGEVCHRCRSGFSLISRKHHCRNCGQVFCHQCSQKQIALPQFGIEREVRVCDACYEQVTKPSTVAKKVSIAKQDDSELPAEYLNSSLSQQSQLPPRKSEEELREEEELQLALALSQSEAEAKEKFKPSIVAPVAAVKVEARQPERTPSPAEGQVLSPELARYLNRSYWENRQSDAPEANRPTSPSAPATAPVQITETKFHENGLMNGELHDFINTLKSQVEIFINRMKSNSSRGRSIANDSSVQTLFLNITAMHSQLLRYIQQHDDSRLYYERLQDKLTQVKDARAALDALRDEHKDKLRRQAEEAERLRQLQMAHKLDIMRKKKQEYLQYQRQLALQRVQEQEREMQMRQEQQKQQYLMGSGYGTYKGSPVHSQYGPPTGYRTYPYDMPMMMPGPQGVPMGHPSLQAPAMVAGMPPGLPTQAGMPPQAPPTGVPSQGPPPNMQPQGPPPNMQPQGPLPGHTAQGPPPGLPTQGPQPGLAPQGLPPGLPQQPSQQTGLSHQQGLPPTHPALNARAVPQHSAAPVGIPQHFQQPGAPPASPQVPQPQQNGDAQTAELISFD